MSDMAIPLTREPVAPERQAAIRAAVRAVAGLPVRDGTTSRIAEAGDAANFLAFLKDPGVHAPIYSLPRPLTPESVAGFIAGHSAEKARGEGFLALTRNEAGEITGYSDVQVWPQWAAGELSGGMRADRQNQGEGARGAAASFAFLFGALGLDLLCETAAPDNPRTARLLDGLGFRRVGEVTSVRPDGTQRPSLVWEITRAEWQARHGAP